MTATPPGPWRRAEERPVPHNDSVAVATSARRILMIEDEPGIRSFASRALKAAGFAVDEAASGLEGLRVARNGPHDLVLLDLGLPDLNGEEVLRRLKQERADRAVLVWSAAAGRDTERRCLLLGAHSYLRKPVPIAELLGSIGVPGSPAAHGIRAGSLPVQRHEHGSASAHGSRPDLHGRHDAAPATRTEGRHFPDPGVPHLCVPPARGRGGAAHRFPSPPSRPVHVAHRELTVVHGTSGGES